MIAFNIIEIIPVEGTEEEVLERAASVCYLAGFPVADVLVAEAKSRHLQPLPATKVETIPDKGARALIGGMAVKVGSPKILVDERIPVPLSFSEKVKSHFREGKSVVVVISGRSLSGAIVLSAKGAAQEEDISTERDASSVPVAGFFERLGTW